MSLLGQLALSPDDIQNVRIIIKHHLEDYPIDFPGWSGLVRRTASKYGLPDPLQYLLYPWRPERWSRHCKEVIFDFWDKKLKEAANEQQSEGMSLELFVTANLNIREPHRLWVAAGRTSSEVTKASVVNWMLMGVFLTRQKLYKYKKVNSPICIYCDPSNEKEEDLYHLLLFCTAFNEIRIPYLKKLQTENEHLSKYNNNLKIMTISILDPESSFLPEEISNNWKNLEETYKLSRNYVFNIFKKRKTLTEKLDNQKQTG